MKPSVNWLLVFIPITITLDHLGTFPAPFVFFSAAIAILPVARLIIRSTEQLASYTGDTVGGLLNATFGNAPELIIAIVALKAGLFDMVRAALLGAILANLLLALGLAFLLGGLKFYQQTYNVSAVRMYGSMLLVAAISLLVPSAFSRVFAPEGMLVPQMQVNVALAVILLTAYALFLVFMLRTHPGYFASEKEGEAHDEKRWSLQSAIALLVGASVLAAWMSEIFVGAAQATGRDLGMSEVFIGVVFLAIVGGSAEIGSTIAMAYRNRMDLAVNIALGSTIQIALFIAPLLVLVSFFIATQPFQLSFTRAEIGSIFMAALIGTIVASDGHSNWYKGVQLITVYAIIAVMFFYLPT